MHIVPNSPAAPSTQAALRAALGPGFQVAAPEAMFRLITKGAVRR